MVIALELLGFTVIFVCVLLLAKMVWEMMK